jgi:hypothetical protein
MRILPAGIVALGLALGGSTAAEEAAPAPAADPGAARAAALAWLGKHANADGSWGRGYSVAVTSLAVLAHVAADDEPFAGERGKPLVRAVEWLLGQAKDGRFPAQGHTWIHGQGYASLALSETYARAMRASTKPDLDLARVRAAVVEAVRRIAETQSASGGWWYHADSPGQHEGSTTVCAVQALVSAANVGVRVDEKVLERGFEYLKRCQNPDGGFDYMMGPGTTSMKEGTAAGIATLALMKRFDYDVMVQGQAFVRTTGAAAIGKERFPYYGWFYAVMGLALYGEEMGASEPAKAYAADVRGELLPWRDAEGSFPLRGWMASSGGEGPAYSTAFAALILSVPDARLTVFRRSPPKLPDPPPAPSAPARH